MPKAREEGSNEAMKAIVQEKYSSAEVLELRDVEKPHPGDDEVLIRVHAAGVDPGVWHLMTGCPIWSAPWALAYASPRSAFVAWTPPGPSRRPGEMSPNSSRVIRYTDMRRLLCGVRLRQGGALGSQTGEPQLRAGRSRADLWHDRPERPHRDAGNLQPGQRVLVIGAAGGVGTYAVQLAKAFERRSQACAARRKRS